MKYLYNYGNEIINKVSLIYNNNNNHIFNFWTKLHKFIIIIDSPDPEPKLFLFLNLYLCQSGCLYSYSYKIEW